MNVKKKQFQTRVFIDFRMLELPKIEPNLNFLMKEKSLLRQHEMEKKIKIILKSKIFLSFNFILSFFKFNFSKIKI